MLVSAIRESAVSVHISPPWASPPSPSHAPRSSRSAELGSLCYPAASQQLPVLHMTVCACQCYPLHLAHPPLPLLRPQVCFPQLHLYVCPANRFLISIFLYSMYMCCMLATQLCLTLLPRGLYPARLLCLWASPGKNTRVGCHILLQEIFPIYLSIWDICLCLFD